MQLILNCDRRKFRIRPWPDWRVHVRSMRGSPLSAAILVIVGSMKELPTTVRPQPFNVEKPAAFVHQFASDELLKGFALAALTIVAAGVFSVVVFSRVTAASFADGKRAEAPKA